MNPVDTLVVALIPAVKLVPVPQMAPLAWPTFNPAPCLSACFAATTGAWSGGAGAMHLWAILTAAVVAAACSIVGTLLVVRRMSLLGDAIGHAVLPGIAVAVLAGARPGGPLVFVAAVATALLTVALVGWLRQAAGLPEDAGAGVIFTTLFALGVLIVSMAARRVDLDPACVLYGILELVPFDTVDIAGFEVPRGFVSSVAVLVSVSLFLAATWKLQVFTAFDTAAARAVGVPVGLVTGGLLVATSVAAVSGFEVVGAVLVVALLVLPAATAELLVHRLHRVMIVAVLVGIVGAVTGYLAAYRWNTSAGGMIAVVLGLEYLAAAALAPDDGLVAQGVARLRFAWRVAGEDRLAAVWRAAEQGIPVSPPRTLFERLAAVWLRASGRIVGPAGLSADGRRRAEMVVRSHRLWEAWLGRHAELPLDHLHPPAEWVEHHLGAEVRQRIEAEVGSREADPHGREIPPEA
jgi:manganese/zinc/iron transport system permease protein